MKKQIILGALLALTSSAFAWTDNCDPTIDTWYEEDRTSNPKFFFNGSEPSWWDSDVGTTAGHVSSGFKPYANRYEYNYFTVFRKLVSGGRTLRAFESYSDGTANDQSGNQWGAARGIKAQIETKDISSMGTLIHNYTDSGGTSRSELKVKESFTNSVSMLLKFAGDCERADVVFYQLYPDVYVPASNAYLWQPWLLVVRKPNGEIWITSKASGTEVVYKVDGITVPENQYYQIKTDITLSTVELNQGSFKFSINPEGSPETVRQVRRRTSTSPETWGALENFARINVLGPCGTTNAEKAVKLPRRIHYAAGIYGFNKSGIWPQKLLVDHDMIWISSVN